MPKLDPARRAARLDLGRVSSTVARELFDQFEVIMLAEVHRIRRVELDAAGLDRDDLMSIARVAVLEAYLTYAEERGSAFKSWVRWKVRWRLVEVVKAAERPEEALEEPDKVLNGHNPADLFERFEMCDWVHSSVGRLSPRQRTILGAGLAGESIRCTAKTLGISATHVHRERKEAYALLREEALAAGIADE